MVQQSSRSQVRLDPAEPLIAIRGAAAQNERLLTKVGEQLGITRVECWVLLYLSATYLAQPVSAIAEALSMSEADVSEALFNLEKMEVVLSTSTGPGVRSYALTAVSKNPTYVELRRAVFGDDGLNRAWAGIIDLGNFIGVLRNLRGAANRLLVKFSRS